MVSPTEATFFDIYFSGSPGPDPVQDMAGDRDDQDSSGPAPVELTVQCGRQTCHKSDNPEWAGPDWGPPGAAGGARPSLKVGRAS